MTRTNDAALFVTPEAPRPLLPSPTRERWELLRSGLVNLYRYDQQEFRFEQGRLLLRGNNGTGKSRVLALQLPFLLDGDVSPDRVEPDRDQAKRIEWNLLMGRHSDRMGYTWVEFGQRGADGAERFVTLGCGLSAVEGRGLVDRWFFVTSQRVGRDLALTGAGGVVANRERLAQSLGDAGHVYRTAKEYRQAVDLALFKLGDRYDALVNLLIQLRQPQLSRALEEQRLSLALSEALPPVSTHILTDIAEAFRGLEADRKVLEDFRSARGAVVRFLEDYRAYTQIAARRRSDRVRLAHSAYEGTMRKLRAAESSCTEADAALGAAAERVKLSASKERAAQSRVSALESSPQMVSAQTLDRVGKRAKELAEEAARAERDLERAAAALGGAAERREDASRTLATSLKSAEHAAAHAGSLADAASLRADHDTTVALLDLAALDDVATVGVARELLEDATQRRLRGVRHLRKRCEEAKSAEQALSAAKTSRDELAGQLDADTDHVRESEEAVASRTVSLGEVYAAWHTSLRELRPLSPEEMISLLADWQERLDSRIPVVEAVATAAAHADQVIATELATAEQRKRELAGQLDTLEAERTKLLAGHHEPPPPPQTRDEASREGRPGAPLWQICDFAEDLTPQHRAGLEGALEASGLLDAWVTPDGRLLAAGTQDTVLLAGTAAPAGPNHRLATLLKPAVDRANTQAAAVSEDVINAVLLQIGIGGATANETDCAWVDVDGRWRLGPLHGYWAKPAAAHIGHGAREAHRRRRLELLAQQIEEVNGLVRVAEEAITRALTRRDRADEERRNCPTDTPLRDAVAQLIQARKAAEAMRLRVAQADVRVEARRKELDAAVGVRDREAADLGIGAWVDRVQQLEDAIQDYMRALDRLWPQIETYTMARRAAAQAASQAERAEDERDRYAERLTSAQGRSLEAAAEYDTLRGTIGADVDQVLAELATQRDQLAKAKESKRKAEVEHSDLRVQLATAQNEAENLRQQLKQDADRRGHAIEALAGYVRTKSLAVACPRLTATDPAEWSVSQAVDLAREIEGSLAGVEQSDAAWERNQKKVFEGVEVLVGALLPYGHDPVRTISNELLVVTLPFQGRACTMGELPDALADEIQQRQMILDAHEREVLERHLIGEVATHLHDRLHEAERLVRSMNDELRKRPMSTGMTLRFTWQPREDGPAGLLEARKKLLGAGVTWSPAEQRALGQFLQEQISAVRDATEAGTWLEHLTLALDYRRWHHFGVERQQDGQWKKLTRRTHGTGSGGEKAIALTIPQFAAAAAHYQSAAPDSPRLILLDEAFVGVDADMRAKCVGLLHAFDLDFVMTSEREWCCYPTLPGVAIYQLAVRPGIDAVGVTRWVWNGQELKRDQPERLPAAVVTGIGGTSSAEATDNNGA